MKTQVRTSVKNGLIQRNRNTFLDVLRSYEGKEVLVTFERPKKKRSSPQNRYYFGLLIPLTIEAIKNEWGEVWSVDKCHEFYKAKFLFTERVNQESGEIIKLPKSTTENTTTAQEDYHAEIRQFLFEWFNVSAPLPNENLQMFND